MLENNLLVTYQADVIDLLTQINDNILRLHDHMTHLKNIQFNMLVLGIAIVILGVIYQTVSKFIK